MQAQHTQDSDTLWTYISRKISSNPKSQEQLETCRGKRENGEEERTMGQDAVSSSYKIIFECFTVARMEEQDDKFVVALVQGAEIPLDMSSWDFHLSSVDRNR